ncbi:hypothetical protein [Streptomyces aurantiacus]|uniref:hypothetical protein n=1 Tax=Streptomyces aurantiacus TaxID=47760 RepID=UPI0006E25F52|nr:hypothetical protein [Streptomyces aurantiacus]
MPEAGQDIQVTRAEDGTVDGTVRVGDEPAGPDFTRAVLDVAGAVLTWPVLGAPGAPGLPTAHVHDAGRAQQWLWALYGERVADAVHDCATGTPSGASAGVTVAVEAVEAVEATTLAGGAARLAFGHWASRWWPASYMEGTAGLEPGVLGLELAALTHRCHQLFDTAFDDQPEPDDCAAELIAEHQTALDLLVRWWLAPSQPADTARHLDSVLRLIDDAADSAGLDGPALRHLRASLDQDQPRPAGTPVDLGTLFARPRGYALAAGEPLTAGSRVITRGTGGNDWRRYPPGFVDAAEDAVSWTVRAVGARRRIEVEVVADVAAPTAGAALVAEVRVDGDRAVRVPLVLRDDLWTGRADLSSLGLDLDLGPDRGLPSAAMPPRIEVGVLLPGFDPGPGAPGDAAHRDAVRALARQRLAAAARPSPYAGAFPEPFLAEIAAVAAVEEDF